MTNPMTPSDTEARMREILRQCSNEMGSSLVSLDSLFGSRQLWIILAAMLRARNEAIEECAKIAEMHEYCTAYFGSLRGPAATGIYGVTVIDNRSQTAIRSQDNPNKQGEG